MRARIDLPSHPVELRIVLQPEHAREAPRYLLAASTTLELCAASLGGIEAGELTLVDPAWHGGAPLARAVLLEPVHWWTPATTMAPELAAARSVSRWCWGSAFDARALPLWFVDALTEITARRAVVPIFEGVNNPPGYAFLEERYFAGFVPRFVRIRLMPETDAAPVTSYRARRAVDVNAPAASAPERAALAGKALLALGTLQRWVGRPVFDAIIEEFLRASKGRAPSLADFERVASDVSGQQLSWFFDEAFRTSKVFDYGLETLASEPDASGAFVTTINVRRYGEARFTGTNGSRTARFDNGRALALRVAFADGQRQTDWWDGRDERRTFRYRSPARAVSATIDPDRVLLLDLEQANNSRTLAPQQSTAATRWATLYLQWLEHLLLSYASLA